MAEEKITDRKEVLSGIIRHTYPANSHIYFFDNEGDTEIIVIVDDEIVFRQIANLDDAFTFSSLVTEINIRSTSLGVVLAHIPDISFEGVDMAEIEHLLVQLETDSSNGQLNNFNDAMNEQLENLHQTMIDENIPQENDDDSLSVESGFVDDINEFDINEDEIEEGQV